MEYTKKKLILFMPSMEGGGVEKNIILVANYLSRHISKINLITFDNRFNKKFSKKIKILNVVKVNKSKQYSKYYKYLRCLILLIKLIIFDKNFLLFTFQANIYCIIISSILGVDVIARSNSAPVGWTKNYCKNFIFRFFFKYAKSIIVNSVDFKNQIDKKFKINSTVIYNPLNLEEIKLKSKIKINFKFFNDNKALKIINIARFTNQKDHITLLKAFKIINSKINTKLLIIGYGSNKKIILEFIKRNNLNKKIKLFNYKDNPYPYIKNSDIFVLTSIYEGLPNVLLEALTLKKFVISSNCPTGPKEILQNGKYGFLFKAKNYIQLSKLILKYSNNKKKYKNKIIHGYKSLERFNLDNNCRKYYNEIVKYL